jgi:CheY-like chemotaxis protein
VDDEFLVRELFGELLRQDRHFVAVAPDGPSALAVFKSGTWDVVLTDRTMPGMFGEELGREIKKLSPGTPVIMITGAEEPPRPHHLDAVLGKPLNLALVAEAITAFFAEDHLFHARALELHESAAA